MTRTSKALQKAPDNMARCVSIAAMDFASGRTPRQVHGFRDDKSNRPCCTLCGTGMMASKEQMRQHENGARHTENYETYLRCLEQEKADQHMLQKFRPEKERIERMISFEKRSRRDRTSFGVAISPR